MGAFTASINKQGEGEVWVQSSDTNKRSCFYSSFHPKPLIAIPKTGSVLNSPNQPGSFTDEQKSWKPPPAANTQQKKQARKEDIPKSNIRKGDMFPTSLVAFTTYFKKTNHTQFKCSSSVVLSIVCFGFLMADPGS